MPRTILMTLLLAPALAGAQTAPLDRAPAALPLHLFAYDRAAPLELATTRTRAVDGVTVHDIELASPAGGTATGRLAVPPGAGPFAGILLMHGAPGDAESQVPWAARLASHGAVVLALDAPWARRGEPPVTFTPQDSAYQVQLIMDLRRGIDALLARDDVDPRRLGYAGGSYGAAMGSLLAGVETRIGAYALAMGDMGLLAHFTGEDDPPGGLPFLEPGQFERWSAAMAPIEPGRFVHRSPPARLFFQAALRDEAVTRSDGARLQAAAGEPKEVVWYDTGHRREEPARLDVLDFFARTLGTRPAERPPAVEVTGFDAGAARRGANTAAVTLLNRGAAPAELDVALRVEPGLWLTGRDTAPVRVTLAAGERRTLELPWTLERMTPEGFVAARVRRAGVDSVIASSGWAVGYGNPDGLDPRTAFELRLAPSVELWTWKGGPSAAEAEAILAESQAILEELAGLIGAEARFGARVVLYPDAATLERHTGSAEPAVRADALVALWRPARPELRARLACLAARQLRDPTPEQEARLAAWLARDEAGAGDAAASGHPHAPPCR